MSTDAQATAIKALLSGVAKAPAFDLDELQKMGSHPPRYVEVHLSRRFGGNVRGDTQANHLRRLQTRVVASTISDARLIEDRISEAFHDVIHDIAGTLVQFDYESGGGAFDYNRDISRYHALTDWTWSV